MNTQTDRNLKSRLGTGLSPMLAVAAIILVANAPARALDDSSPVLLRPFSLAGFQPNSSAPFILQGDLFGDGAIWKRVVGPILGTTFGMTSSPAGGTGFQVEYSQDQIVTEDGTITLNLYGVRSTPYGSPGAHITNGAYDIVGGTGRFQGIIGTGTVTIDARADGSTFILIGGTTHCPGGMCITKN